MKEMKSSLRRIAAVVVLSAGIGSIGCGSTLRFNMYPPGAQVAAGGDSCVNPCQLELRTVPPRLRYRVDKQPLYRSAEGEIQTRIAPGRVVGAIFTLGIVAMARGLYYVPPTEIQLEPARDPGADLGSIHARGTGRIEGQAFTETLGGEIRHAAGDTITLLPDTPYVRDAVEYLALAERPAEGLVTSDPDLEFLDIHNRQTIGDAEGRFVFEGLSPGRYLVSATVSWDAPGVEGLTKQLVRVVGFADVHGGATTKTLVTDWAVQEYGIGKRGEAVLPSSDVDAEHLGQRRVPVPDEDR